MLPDLWTHQKRCLGLYNAAVMDGHKAIVITAPTAAGKTRIMSEIAKTAADEHRRVLILTNRRLLTDQSSTVFSAAGIDHGIMAAGWELSKEKDIQIASVQTLISRVYKRAVWDFFDADLVLVDESHNSLGEETLKVLGDHLKQDSIVVGITATPVSHGGFYKRMIVAATKQELRENGCIVPAVTYAPDEPDMSNAKTTERGEYVVDEVVRRIMVSEDGASLPRIFGSVEKHLRRLNPNLEPTLLFAPDVPSSRWFAQDLTRRGIPTAHIEADTPMEDRLKIIEQLKAGTIKVLSNRFVLREGVDLPFLKCCVLATAFGALSSYLQAGGRMLRSHPGKAAAIILDHGGNWIRHGSLNDDIEWTLEDTDRSLAAKRKEKFTSPTRQDPEPICCPQCGAIRRFGPQCPECKFQHQRSVRMVVQTNGTLKKA